MAYQDDEELEASTNRVMLIGAVLLFAMVAIFPLYRVAEPLNRDEARQEQMASLARSGEQLWSLNCGSCHGLNGEGGAGPALNSKQFLQGASDQQIDSLISVGIPGSQMSAYSQDNGGPLTVEQVKAIRVYMRGWEDGAPDRPEWRAMMGG